MKGYKVEDCEPVFSGFKRVKFFVAIDDFFDDIDDVIIKSEKVNNTYKGPWERNQWFLHKLHI